MRRLILPSNVNTFCRVLSFLVASLWALPAPGQAPELSAEQPIAYSEETGLLIASENAVYRDENTTVEADEIRYNRNDEQIEARGNVRVTRVGLRLLARELTYNTAARSFSATGFRVGYPPLFIEGESFSGNLDAVDFENISLYFREPVERAPKLSVARGTWVADDYLRGRGLSIETIGNLSLPLPGFTYAFGQPTLDVDASVGYRDNLGVFGQSFWLYPFSEDLSLGGNLDFYSERGILLGPAADWTSRDGLIQAFVNTGWIHDHSSRERGNDILGNRIDQSRGFAEARLAARNEEGTLQLQARSIYLSDSEVMRDFREDRYFDTYHPDTFLDFTWQSDRLLLNAFARSQINDGYRVVERLPEIHAEWLPGEIGSTGLVLQAQATATRYRTYDNDLPRITFPSGPLGLPPVNLGDIPPPPSFTPPPPPSDLPPPDTLPSEPAPDPEPDSLSFRGPFQNRLDASATLTRPFHFDGGISLVLRGGTRWTHYEWEGTGPSSERTLAELGFDLSRTLQKTYGVGWSRLGIEDLRHEATTRVTYRWHPRDIDREKPIFFNETAFYRALPPVLDLADLTHGDVLREWNVARLGWENRFLAAGDDGEFRPFLRFNLYQDLLFSAPSGRDEWDAFYTEIEFTPVPWLDLLWMQKYRTEGFRTEASFFRTTLRSSDLWAVSFQAEFLETAIEQYDLDGRYRLSENLGLFGNWQFDSRLDTWTRQRYGISQRFGNVWQAEFYVTFTDQDRRQDDFSVGLRLRWLSF